jgi:uncharacterized protein (DUF697 family)
VGDLGHGVHVHDVDHWVAKLLQINQLGVCPQGLAEVLRIVGIDEGGFDAVAGQRVAEDVVGAAVGTCVTVTVAVGVTVAVTTGVELLLNAKAPTKIINKTTTAPIISLLVSSIMTH